jgi:hypothetical protein
MKGTIQNLALACFFGVIALGIYGLRAQPSGEGIRHMTGEMVGCQNRATIERMGELFSQKDSDAALQLAFGGIANGDCIKLFTGDAIVIEQEPAGGISKMHLQGKPTAYWTFSKLVGP